MPGSLVLYCWCAAGLGRKPAGRGVRYTFRQAEFRQFDLPGGAQIGVLAQEVEKVYPELVSTDAQGCKAVNYAQLTPVLIKALKEQQTQVEALKQEVAAANAKAATAEADHAALPPGCGCEWPPHLFVCHRGAGPPHRQQRRCPWRWGASRPSR